MPIELKVSEEVTLIATPTDVYGNTVRLDGPPQWSSSNEAIATVFPVGDGYEATVVPTGLAGSVRISAEGDSDLTGGYRLIKSNIDINITGGEATLLQITARAPIPK